MLLPAGAARTAGKAQLAGELSSVPLRPAALAELLCIQVLVQQPLKQLLLPSGKGKWDFIGDETRAQ